MTLCLQKGGNLISFGLSDNVQIVLVCGINTDYGVTNGISDFRCHHLLWLHEIPLIEHDLFTQTFAFKLFHVSIC